RTADFCAELAASAEASRITAATGLVIDAYFSGSKIRWILDHTPGARSKARDGELLFGNVDTWLIWNLTGGAAHVTDPSNASRTMLMNLETGDWDDDLLRIFDVPRAMLPAIRPSSGVVGTTNHLGAEIPIAGIAGDQQAALAGQACFRPGLSKNTYGTVRFGLLHPGQAHLARAALESIAYQTRELVEAMEADSGERLSELRVDGGAAVNDFLMQFQADILGRPIVRPVDIETTALGAAYLAGLAVGFWKSVEEIEGFWRADRRFEPQMQPGARELRFGEWKS